MPFRPSIVRNYFLGSEDESAKEMVANLKRDTARLYLDVILPFVGEAGSRILEVGCGSGDFLVEARKRGLSVQGIEFSEHAAAVANERLGETAVLVGSPETVTLPANSYDVLAAFDVIEHLRDPKMSIDWMYLLLKRGGVAAIVTPSLDSWSRRLLGRHWMEYKPEHITYFSQKSLRRLLENAGFSSIQFVPNYKVLTYDYIARHFDRFQVPVVSAATRVVRTLMPDAFANRKWKLVASGTMAIARKGV